MDKAKQRDDATQKAADLVRLLNKNSSIAKAFLFGSATRGEMTRDSDLDILVVLKDGESTKKVSQETTKPFFSNIAIDWFFKSESEFEKKKLLGGVCFEAYHHGIELNYD